MKQECTTKRNFRTMAAFAAALLALAAAGTALASQQFVSLTVQGPVDTRTGTRAADETEPILLSARLPGAGESELWIDGVAQGRVDDIWPDGRIVDNTYEWLYPEDEDPETVHVMILQRNGKILYTARFGGPVFDKHSANGIPMGWLINWKDFVAEHYMGDYEAAAEGVTVGGVKMYDAYVGAMDPTDPDAKITLIPERLPGDGNQIQFSVAGSQPTDATGPRYYVLETIDNLVFDGSGTPPAWRAVGELPGGTLKLTPEEIEAIGRFFRVKVLLP